MSDTVGDILEKINDLYYRRRIAQEIADYLNKTYLCENPKKMRITEEDSPVSMVPEFAIEDAIEDFQKDVTDYEKEIEELKGTEV